MNIKKLFTIFMTFIVVFIAVFPVHLAAVFASSTPTPVDFPEEEDFIPYTDKNNNPIRDIAGEVNPSDTDITSGVDSGYGNLPSVYVAADGDGKNLFIRYRMKANPYDRKGGFLSTAWVVQIIKDINGTPTQVATVGLDGKSPSVDYVYVADGDGRKVKPIYQTTGTPNPTEPIPGTRIVEAENGHYFLDFQVPISEIVAISDAEEIVGQNMVMLYFGTSKAANLAVINKEWMSEDKTFDNLKEIRIENPGEDLVNPQPIGIEYPTITIDEVTGSNSDGHFTSNNITVTGTVSVNKPITIEINGKIREVTPTEGNGIYTWTTTLSDSPALIEDVSGDYTVFAFVEDNNITAKASTEFKIVKASQSTDLIYINGGSYAETTSSRPIIDGTYVTNRGNSVRVFVKVNNGSWTLADSSHSPTPSTWEINLASKNITLNEGNNTISVRLTNNQNNQNPPYAETTQTLKYTPPSEELSVAITSVLPLGSTTPTISGTSTSADTVTITTGGWSGDAQLNQQNGDWSITVPDALSPGLHTIEVTAYSGSQSETDTRVHIVQSNLSVTITSVGPVGSATPTISGSSTDAKMIDLYYINESGNEILIEMGIKPDTNGSWESSIERPLSSGSYTIKAVAINEAKNEVVISTKDHTVNELSITIDNGVGPLTINNDTPIIRGGSNASNGSTVTVDFGNGLSYEGEVQNGRWAIEVDSPLDDDTYTITASVEDNSQTATGTQNLTIKASTTVAITAPNNGATITETKRPPISGTADLDASVNLMVTDSNSDFVIVESLVAQGGAWSYTPTSELNNGTYTITANASDLYGNTAEATSSFTIGSVLSDSKEITNFKFASMTPEVVGTIDQTAKTITLTVPHGTDVTNIVPTIEHTGVSIDPNNEEAQDFTSAVTYTVTAADGSTQQYRVTVTEGASSSKEITSFNFADLNPEVVGEIDQTAKTITLTVPHGTDVTNIVPTIEHTGASIDPNNQVAQDFTSAVMYTVTAADGSTQPYTVTVSVQGKTAIPNVTEPVRAGNTTISGTSEPNAVIKITKDGHEIGIATADGDGNWTISFYEGITLAGNEELKVTAKVTGKVESEVTTVNVTGIPTPEITGSTDGNGTVTVSGAIPGADVILYDKDGKEVGRTTANLDGRASFSNVSGGVDYYVTQTVDGVTSDRSNKINVVEVFGSEDGARTVTVIGATPDATVKLYNIENVQIGDSIIANQEGYVQFTIVPPNVDYYVTQTVEGVTSDPSNKVDVLPRIAVRYSLGEIWESVTLPVFLMNDESSDTPTIWESNNEDIIKIESELNIHENQIFPEYKAIVNRKEKDVNVILTAKVKKGYQYFDRTFLLVVKGTADQESKITTDSSNPVKIGGVDQPTGDNQSVNVTRTALTRNGVTQNIDKMQVLSPITTAGDSLLIEFDDTPPGLNRADEITADIVYDALKGMTGKPLTLKTPEGSITLPTSSLTEASNRGIDLFFRIVPVRTEIGKNEVVERIKDEMQSHAGQGKIVAVLDIPREIHTNYSGIDTEITLPLTNVNIPINDVNSLRVFIEHSDGAKRIVEPGNGLHDGKFEYANGSNQPPTGYTFTINKFSTFTFFQVTDQLPTGGGGGYTPTPQVEFTGLIGAGQNTIEIEYNQAIGSFNKDGLAVIVNGEELEIVDVVVTNNDKRLVITLKELLPQGVDIYVNYDVQKGGVNEKLQLLKMYKLQTADFHAAYIKGFPDGTFKPEENVTRAQMAAMLARNLGFDESTKALHSPYPDVLVTHWAANVIQFVKDEGLMQGDPTGNFRPDAPITRAEMAAIVARFKDLTVIETMKGTFTDNSNHWATGIIEANRNSGILEGYEDGSFRPNKNLTRAEASKVVNRMFDRGPLYGITTPSWPDVAPTHWAYHEIEEASQDHYYTIRPEGGENIVVR